MNVLLFSGGLDSTAIAFWKRPQNLLFVDYGQLPAKGEYRAACKIAEELAIPFESVTIDASRIGTGDLIGKASIDGKESEFWPFRNQFLVTVAAMRYGHIQPLNVIIGTVASDNCHPDGSKAFIHGLDALLSVQGGVTLQAPAQAFTSAKLLEISQVPIDLLGWTFSCHRNEYACGQCRGCRKHVEQLSKSSSIPPRSSTCL